jgi:hypothetical protein
MKRKIEKVKIRSIPLPTLIWACLDDEAKAQVRTPNEQLKFILMDHFNVKAEQLQLIDTVDNTLRMADKVLSDRQKKKTA